MNKIEMALKVMRQATEPYVKHVSVRHAPMSDEFLCTYQARDVAFNASISAIEFEQQMTEQQFVQLAELKTRRALLGLADALQHESNRIRKEALGL